MTDLSPPRRVTKIAFPPESQLHPLLARAYFHDAFEAELRDVALSPVAIALRALRATPEWAEGLLALRDRMVRPLGIKTVGRLGKRDDRPPGDYAIGDTLSIFTVVAITPTEVVLGIDDTHLDVRIAFLKRLGDGGSRYAVCSVVTTHNALGKVYMLPVAVVHPLLVKTMMRHVAM
jgi:hypothetical protein